MFLQKVFTRTECRKPYWKERFLDGLPRLFSQTVKNALYKKYDGNIPYEDLTYGDLISFINNEALIICTDLKLKAKLKNELKHKKTELSGFCSQYGYEKILPPSIKYKKDKKTKTI